MARRPANLSWFGFNAKQQRLLNLLDNLGEDGWEQTGPTNEIMPILMADLAAAGVSLEETKAAMASIGYGWAALRQLERWESKRITGNFGR